jgi:hypothetical protein
MKKFDFPSRSNPIESHTVTLHDGERLTCTCRGFRTPNRCWHVKKVAEDLGLNVVIGGELIGNSITGYKVATAPKQESLLEPAKEIPIRPMLASGLKDGQSIEDFKNGWILEEKFDGHRLIVQVGPEITAWSRAGNIRTLAKHIRASLQCVAPGIYDGELCIPGGTSTDVTAIDKQDESRLILFDMLAIGAVQITDKTYAERRTFLEAAFEKCEDDTALRISDQFAVSAQELQKIWDSGGEGAILKRTAAVYQPDYRSRDWVKFKQEQTAVLEIIGFVPGLLGPHSKIALRDTAGVEIQVKALNDEWRRVFALGHERFIGKKMRISYQEKTVKGKYRHPMADHILEEFN